MNQSVLVLTTSFPLYPGVVSGTLVFDYFGQLIKPAWHVMVVALHYNKGVSPGVRQQGEDISFPKVGRGRRTAARAK